ncbi:zinc finger CCHC domain-containing protein 8 homolog isoform X3 [Homarus americanus]|uniref:zinc finger CCHC domain-containing protein 8 homolog isoform X3 n=1 Tax=Homarus americanus TaxID=6706 RepID=UPI001C43742E|nr:zinc finger CCHC domain-containing protein 8 homolog isoform X3 [Homarus americanus]
MFTNMQREEEERVGSGAVAPEGSVVNCSAPEKDHSGCESIKEDSVIEDVANSSNSLPPPEEMIVLDTTAEDCPDEPDKTTPDESIKEDSVNEDVANSSNSFPPPEEMIVLDTTAEGCPDEQDKATPDESIKEDSVNEDVANSSNSFSFPEEMIVLDTTPEGCPDEQDKATPDEFVMPEGVCLDTDGDEISILETVEHEPQAALDVVPSYETDFAGVLSDIEYSMLTGKKIKEPRQKKNCFNCLGDHNLSECKERHDLGKIAENRRKLINFRVSAVRYHEDTENKYGHYQPGKISENLRHALGLKPNQLPLFIYRMRVLGYPPGWLLDAEVHKANVRMFDASGESVSHPDTEDGEAEPNLVKYKPERLVSFPGFNDPVPQGVRDEYQEYSFPPLQPCHQRSEFLRYMNMNKAEAYKKKKLKGSELRSKSLNASLASAGEMEVDVESEANKLTDIEFNPPLPEEPLPPPPPLDAPPPPPPQPQKRPYDVEDGEISEDSQASLGDLEAKRLKILSELEDASSSQGADVQEEKKKKENIVKSVEINKTEYVAENSEDSKMSSTSAADSNHSENSSTDVGESTSKQKRHHRSHSKGFRLGVVIPDSCTTYKTLPDSVKWTVDVSDHIVFENLPDALGTWNKMKGLMNNVKKRMTELHADEDD